MRRILIAAAAIASLGTALPASAQESIEVTYRDLNLDTAEGQKALDRRIVRAARQVCGLEDIHTGTRIRPAREQQCYRTALVQAKARVAAIIEAEKRGG
ncbi:UrcA family protein [Leptolyngbya sp. 15MV]|nr:UrcA family protein [Leptolyngbya sp. 15MV]